MQRSTFFSVPQRRDFAHTDPSGRCYVHPPEEIDARGFVSRAWSRFKASVRLMQRIGPRRGAEDQIALFSGYYPHGNVALDHAGRGGAFFEEVEFPRLCIMFHGLGGRPHEWVPLMNMIEDESPDSAFFAPEICDFANAQRKNCARRAYLLVKEWFDKHPDGQILMLSYSAGAPVAAEFDLLLRSEGRRACFVSVAGLFFGTRWVNLMRSTRWIFARTLEGDHVGNAEARILIERMRGTDERPPISEFFFILSTEDDRVMPWCGSAPCLGHEQVIVLHDNLHFEVIHAASVHVMRIWNEYLARHNPQMYEDDIDELSE